MATYEFTVGRLLARSVRDFLARAKFGGLKIEYIESTGWIERTFTVKGSEQDLRSIDASLKEWSKKMDENKST